MYNIMDLSRIVDMIQQDVQQFFLGTNHPLSQRMTHFKWHSNLILYLPLRVKTLHAWKMFYPV